MKPQTMMAAALAAVLGAVMMLVGSQMKLSWGPPAAQPQAQQPMIVMAPNAMGQLQPVAYPAAMPQPTNYYPYPQAPQMLPPSVQYPTLYARPNEPQPIRQAAFQDVMAPPVLTTPIPVPPVPAVKPIVFSSVTDSLKAGADIFNWSDRFLNDSIYLATAQPKFIIGNPNAASIGATAFLKKRNALGGLDDVKTLKMDATAQAFTVNDADSLAPGVNKFVIETRLTGAPSVTSGDMTVVVPDPKIPTTDKLSILTGLNLVPPPPLLPAANFSLYGRRFLLQGQHLRAGSDIVGYIFDSSGNVVGTPSNITRSALASTSDGFQLDISMSPDLPRSQPFKMLLYVKDAGGIRPFPQSILFTVVAYTAFAKPAISTLNSTTVDATTKVNNEFGKGSDKTYITKSESVLVVPAANKLPDNLNKDDVTVLVTVNNSTMKTYKFTQFFNATGETVNQTNTLPTIPLTANRSNSIQFGLVVGFDTPIYSDPVIVSVRTDSPQVVDVTPTDLSRVPKNEIRVRFNPENPLELASAQTVSNYDLQPSIGSSNQSPTSATLDIGSNTVLLAFSKDLLPNSYSLVLHGDTVKVSGITAAPTGLVDIYGNPFNKSQFLSVATILRPVTEDLPPSVTNGVTAAPAPQPVYPEYIKFNPDRVSNGFNPSDKVVTKVAQLFYQRDAHRVAQIINQKVKSYNLASVDIRRRQADKARDAADELTFNRRKDEREAVRRASETRAKEAELKQAQASLEQFRQDKVKSDRDAQNKTFEGKPIQNQIDNLTTQIESIKATLGSTPAAGQPPIDQTALKTQQTSLETQRSGLQLQADTVKADQANAQKVSASFDAMIQSTQQRVQDLQVSVEALRSNEVKANETAIQTQGREDLSKQEEFRRSVAAMREDPNTVAVGDPDSIDPVAQVNITVIGEGLIQLRGPIKGVNMIRIMINQIDAPVGQVRIGVHTMQINGERGDKMQLVADQIQTAVDQARFLTAQTAEALRRSIVNVASRRAMQAPACPEGAVPIAGLADHDQRYLLAFFGSEFIAQLRDMDSEFLRTGNKLLSLNSMDTTSLASSLFLMSLAKNSVRAEILREFQQMLQCDLQNAELSFLSSGNSFAGKTKMQICMDKLREHCKPMYLLSPNAKFASFLGYFSVEADIGDDVMTPFQREFLKLAQFLKARLITELEFNQRIFERAQLEERLGNYVQELQKAKDKEAFAVSQYEEERGKLQAKQADVIGPVLDLITEARVLGEQINLQYQLLDGPFESDAFKLFHKKSVEAFKENLKKSPKKTGNSSQTAEMKAVTSEQGDSSLQSFVAESSTVGNTQNTDGFSVDSKSEAWAQSKGLSEEEYYKAAFNYTKALMTILDKFQYYTEKPLFERAKINMDKLEKNWGTIDEKTRYKMVLLVAYDLRRISPLVLKVLNGVVAEANPLMRKLANPDTGIVASYLEWLRFRVVVQNLIQDRIYSNDYKAQLKARIQKTDETFQGLLQTGLHVEFLKQAAGQSRRPLDVKKLLDMLVDDVEEKYIELLEGTRGQISNIDGYVKRLITALDDDLNRSYYDPSFRAARSASRAWDVELGILETTTVLTNNRAMAKVSPSASFEFDLPKRDILIKEGFKAAKAAIDDYGALVNDPSFLSLAKTFSGQPAASMTGSVLGGSPVRNVLPGLPTSSDEVLLAQQGPGRREFGSALEALIPDPAIYKFETGTGFEIRPVLSPDGQSVVFRFNYMYTFDVREPVRADEKHLGRVKRHFIDTDVQLGNFELREVSRYQVALKVARTGKGVPLLQDIPGIGLLFRPLPSASSSFQENLVYAQSTIFPTLYELMGLRYAPAVADLDPLKMINADFIVRYRKNYLSDQVFDLSSAAVDKALLIPEPVRRSDLYRPQISIPRDHPNGYNGPGLGIKDSVLQEGYDPRTYYPQTPFSRNDSIDRSGMSNNGMPGDGIMGTPVPFGTMPEGMPSMLPTGSRPTSVLPNAASGARAPGYATVPATTTTVTPATAPLRAIPTSRGYTLPPLPDGPILTPSGNLNGK